MRRFYNRPQKRAQPEAHLVLQILKYLALRGIVAGKAKVKGGILSRGKGFFLDPYLLKGLPDIFAFNQNTKVMYGIECKVKGNKQTLSQKFFERFFHYPPTRIYIIAYSLEDVEKALMKS